MDSSSSEGDGNVSEQFKSPPPTKKRWYLKKESSESSDSNSNSNSDSSSNSLDQQVYKKALCLLKAKWKKDSVKVHSKDNHHRSERSKWKQYEDSDDEPKTKMKKESAKYVWDKTCQQ